MVEKRRQSSRLTVRLLSLTAVVLIVPWLGFKSLSTMEAFLLDGQAQAQLLTAQGIAALLGDRPHLFEDSPAAVEGFAELPLYPADGTKVLDGYADDWQSLWRFRQRFSGTDGGPAFSLLMAEHRGLVHGFVKVTDDAVITRNPGILRMDKSDHLRFYFSSPDGNVRRVLVAFEGNGPGLVYRMDSRWRHADPGSPEYRLRAQAVMTEDGYNLEFRFPLEWLGATRRMGLAVADVRDRNARSLAGITATFPLEEDRFNPVIMRSTELASVVKGFSGEDARLWILDRHNRVSAVVGDLRTEEGAGVTEAALLDAPWWQLVVRRLTGWLVGLGRADFEDFDADTVQRRNDDVYRQALAGEPAVGRRPSLDKQAEIITAAHPVIAGGDVVGVLLLEKSTRDILQLQRRSVETLAGLTVLGTLVISLLLLAFAYRLAWRIKRLGADASRNVDEFGRFVGGSSIRGTRARDEVGLLARTIDRILDRLRQHQTFLRNIPRTLRHEINNPLNIIGTSLDSIERGESAGPYLERARRGLARIGQVVNSLAEAASLEQALQAEELVPLDLAELLRVYVNHQTDRYGIPLILNAPKERVMIAGCGEHLEEALDKLLDNARDFSAAGEGGPIEIGLTVAGSRAVLQITNRGPVIPDDLMPDLFQFMSGTRSGGNERHYGLGLYVARIIVEHHRGAIAVRNLADGSGVCFTVELPLLV